MFLLCSKSFAQIVIMENHFSKGELLGINDLFVPMYLKPDSNSVIIETISSLEYGSSLTFIVEEPGDINGFVYVKNLLDYSNAQTSSNMIVLPDFIGLNGNLGYVHKSLLEKRPTPEPMALKIYKDEPWILKEIERNLIWKSANEKEWYSMHKYYAAEFYFILGEKYAQIDSNEIAIFYYSKAIKEVPKKSFYMARAIQKSLLEDHSGCIADCEKYIYYNKSSTIIPNNPSFKAYMENTIYKYDMLINPYGVMAFSYIKQKNWTAAITSCNNGIAKSPDAAELYHFRAIAKININQKNSACLDWSKAGELGFQEAYSAIREYCNN